MLCSDQVYWFFSASHAIQQFLPAWTNHVHVSALLDCIFSRLFDKAPPLLNPCTEHSRIGFTVNVLLFQAIFCSVKSWSASTWALGSCCDVCLLYSCIVSLLCRHEGKAWMVDTAPHTKLFVELDSHSQQLSFCMCRKSAIKITQRDIRAGRMCFGCSSGQRMDEVHVGPIKHLQQFWGNNQGYCIVQWCVSYWYEDPSFVFTHRIWAYPNKKPCWGIFSGRKQLLDAL